MPPPPRLVWASPLDFHVKTLSYTSYPFLHPICYPSLEASLPPQSQWLIFFRVLILLAFSFSFCSVVYIILYWDTASWLSRAERRRLRPDLVLVAGAPAVVPLNLGVSSSRNGSWESFVLLCNLSRDLAGYHLSFKITFNERFGERYIPLDGHIRGRLGLHRCVNPASVDNVLHHKQADAIHTLYVISPRAGARKAL